MKYYKYQSNPLREITPQPGSYVYDEYGNLVSFDMMGNKEIVVKTVLVDDFKLTDYEDPKGSLKGFWSWSTKDLLKKKYGIIF